MRLRQTIQRVWERAQASIDASGLAVFRALFGVLAVAMPLRCMAYGWVDRFFVQPTYFFSYWGFEWVRALPAPWIHAVFVAMELAGALIAIGLFYRAAILTFFVLFTYVELIDVTTYLNHYYLVSLFPLLMSFMPPSAAWSVDAWWRQRRGAATPVLRAWMVWLLRFQVGVVYVFAALAKANADWLLHAQPLSIWLGARMDTPVVGAWFDHVEVAYAMSWGGFLYDLTIPLWLSWRRTRPVAFAVVLAFHAMTHVLFDIGMFPLIMTVAATLFFDPRWPRRWLERLRPAVSLAAVSDERAPRSSFGGLRAAGAAAVLAWCALQVLMPLRAHAYGRDVLWDEQGMRWSWRVLCREKTGAVTYRVRARGWGGEREIPPRRYLTTDQEFELVGQPDLILQLAHHIRDDLEGRGERDVEVRVDALASLNGRRSAPLIDPEVDLARVEDSLGDATWILPAPRTPPPRLRRASMLASSEATR